MSNLRIVSSLNTLSRGRSWHRDFIKAQLGYVHLLFIAFLFLGAFGLRLYRINDPPLNFHATRQYRSLLIARDYYYRQTTAVPVWQKQIAQINRERQGVLEPPVMEMLAAAGYRLAGGERLWVPKLLSTLFWLIGAGCLYQIARKLANSRAALFSVACYLFLPFAVAASRSFQPDPMMVTLLLASLLAMLRYNEEPSPGRLAVVTGFSAVAILIKPLSLFAVCAVFISLTLQREGLRKTITNRALFVYLSLIFLPVLLFYIFYGLFVIGDLRPQAQASFLPQLWFDSFFWRGWLDNIQQVVGYPALVVALLGVLLFQPGRARAAVIGLWSGYALFCLVFNYHIATHDYYHLQLVPIVALSLGPVAALIYERLHTINKAWPWRMVLWSILLLALLLSLDISRGLLLNPGFEQQVETAETIGDLVSHSANTIYLASDYGASLQYHGELAGRPWPLVSDLEWERLAGVPILDAEARFHEWFAGESPGYFIVMDLWQFEQQPDLRRFLATNFATVAQEKAYIIFELQAE
jgi:4-amino-4-deoxy-L-arabinose transferase-like glycosyltransferase